MSIRPDAETPALKSQSGSRTPRVRYRSRANQQREFLASSPRCPGAPRGIPRRPFNSDPGHDQTRTVQSIRQTLIRFPPAPSRFDRIIRPVSLARSHPLKSVPITFGEQPAGISTW